MRRIKKNPPANSQNLWRARAQKATPRFSEARRV
jgi:hypothetical protein